MIAMNRERIVELNSFDVEQLDQIVQNRHAGLPERMFAYLFATGKTYNSENRATTGQHGTCVYEPLRNSPGCAVGRLNPKLAGIQGGYGQVFEHDKERIEPFMLDFPKEFVQDIQSLHDVGKRWDLFGLNHAGRAFFNQIQTNILLYVINGVYYRTPQHMVPA